MGGRRDFCNITLVGEPLYYMAWGSPVSDRVFRTVQYHYTQLGARGEDRMILDRFRLNDACSDNLQNAGGGGMKIDAMGGPLIISTVFVLAGVCFHCIEV